MPDVSKHEAVLQGLKNGTYRTLDVTIGSHKINAGEKIPKAGEISIDNIWLGNCEDQWLIFESSWVYKKTPNLLQPSQPLPTSHKAPTQLSPST